MRNAAAAIVGLSLLLSRNVKAQTYDAGRALSIGIVLFPGFQPLDVIGPLDIIQILSGSHNMTLSMIWKETGPVWARAPPRKTPPPANPSLPPAVYPVQAPHIVATHTFDNTPPLDILLVPGGMGNRVLHENNDTVIEDFVAARYGELQYLLSVCTGAASLAKSGLLNGRHATTNKAAWAWATQFGDGVEWVPTARWTEDGNIWTSSGVSAGIDMTYAFFRMLLGEAAVDPIINAMEYTPHTDRHWDPYSVVHHVPGADTSRPLGDCVGPAGYEYECPRKNITGAPARILASAIKELPPVAK
ncbi:class I glutamine amidotransferase-like protein [Lasiosphaeria hispida]|uniref:Class I glutamine amidotransferase-like protein n=1 Tax=Lasiosphaeria hispida TaxID=260671 RepID=A0AAJ0HD33_9PEZI|nr:class I glutamine amidotransferase-like protein [Lasiosphaeria hispida]